MAERDAYDAAIAALLAYLATLGAPFSWFDLSGNTDVEGTVLYTRFATVYEARRTLLNAVAGVTKNLADAAISGAADAAADAAAAGAEAASAQNRINAIVSDSVLDRSEKPDVVQRRAEILAERAGILASADSFGITGARATYDAAVVALTDYLDGMVPGYADYSADTAIDRAVFNSRFTAVSSGKQALLDMISALAATRATWGGVTGVGRPEDGATVGAPVGTNVAGVAASSVASTISPGGGVAANQVSTVALQDGVVTGPKIASLAVQTANIDNLSVTNLKINNVSVDHSKLTNTAKTNLMVRNPFGPGPGPYYYANSGVVIDEWTIAFSHPAWIYLALFADCVRVSGSSSLEPVAIASVTSRPSGSTSTWSGFSQSSELVWTAADDSIVGNGKQGFGTLIVPEGSYDFRIRVETLVSNWRFKNGWNHLLMLWGSAAI